MDQGLTQTAAASTGCLHESAHTRWLGSPKTASSAHTITPPPFLISLLRKHLERHDNEFVFTAEGGTWLWRSTFIRPVADIGSTRARSSRPSLVSDSSIGSPVTTLDQCLSGSFGAR